MILTLAAFYRYITKVYITTGGFKTGFSCWEFALTLELCSKHYSA